MNFIDKGNNIKSLKTHIEDFSHLSSEEISPKGCKLFPFSLFLGVVFRSFFFLPNFFFFESNALN